MKKSLLLIISFLVIFSVMPPEASAVTNASTSTDDQVNIIVKYKNTKKSPITNEFNLIREEDFVDLLEVPATDLEKTIVELEGDSNIEYVEKEISYSFFGSVNDPYFNSFQATDFSLIQAPQAWDVFNPQQTPIVAVLDSGIDLYHPDLKNLIYKPYNAMYPGQPPYDDVSHGTHVAGTVGADTNNGIGIASVSKGVKIMPVKVGDYSGISNYNVAMGIYYAVDNGASIINMSLGGGYSQLVKDAVDYAYDNNVLVIAAAGNSSTSNKSASYPAALENVVAVSAVDSTTNRLAYFSNYGDWVDVAAPGVDIFSTYPGQSYDYKDGTSMASPMVASLAALIKGHEPSLYGNQIRWIIEYSADSYIGSYHFNGRMNAYQTFELFNNYSRIFGANSIETSNEIADAGWGESLVQPSNLQPNEESLNNDAIKSSGNFAILASNQNFPDSLAAGALAYKLGVPILLTPPSYLMQETINTINELNVNTVIVLGGTTAISEVVVRGLKNAGKNIIRLKGTDRFSTAVEVNDYIAKKGDTVIISNGLNFPDALSVSSFSASNQIPIVFVEKDRIPQSTMDFLNKYDFSSSIVIGGTGVISDNVVKNLPNPIRISGKDRYETNLKVIDYFTQQTSINGFLFATGRNFPDALAGGPLSAKINYPLVLVDGENLPSAIKTYVDEKVKEEYINDGEFLEMNTLGGKKAITPKLVWQLDHIIYNYYYQYTYNPNYFNNNSAPNIESDFISKAHNFK